MTHPTQLHTDVIQDRFALKLASYLEDSTSDLPYDITERMRAARYQAIAQRKTASVRAPATATVGQAVAVGWGSDEGFNWWSGLGSALALLALVIGMLAINAIQDDNLAQEVAEVDEALLIDALPPAAFSDPGFVQFLKSTL